MHSTTTIDGSTARIVPHGDIDFTALADLRASRAALPPEVTTVTWDLHDAAFMDVAGLHLLTDHLTETGHPHRTAAVTGLTAQPDRLLRLASDLFPAMGFDQLLPGAPLDQAA
ncbi:STAS domain-containing protein [Streptomyces tropicalis]|uniref:STAS domain-containing protein n=1 Tax=Streptomyces tropicalis TaxID=3034234 RepID=A0ABT5ZZQ6_9ACTN|nr:STAS domain-containing protein [Streptomyces tropicalis]MDF3297080.1 STAS domain-containing protein [Streptomyces tropicalis]